MGYEKNTCVLIVDDSLMARRFVRTYLKKMGLTAVIEAPNIKKGLETLKTREVGLILSDWSMPGRSGLDFLRSVRSDKDLKNIPFILITAEGLKSSITEAFEAGVSGYILKPYRFETFRSEIQRVIS